KRLAARRKDAPSAGPFARLHGVEPVQPRLMKQLDEARRDMDVGMPVARTCLEHADADAGIRAQPVCQHTTRAARADDHVVECVHSVLFFLVFVLAASWA